MPKITKATSRPALNGAFRGTEVEVGAGVGETAGVAVIYGVIVGTGVSIGDSEGLGVIVGERVVEAVTFSGMLRPVSQIPVSSAYHLSIMKTTGVPSSYILPSGGTTKIA